MREDECEVQFRFRKPDIHPLVAALHLPETLKCPNGAIVDRVEALCVTLKRFTYLCRYADLVPRFGRPVPQLCVITNLVVNYLYENSAELSHDLRQPWLSQQHLQMHADAIHYKGAALDNCWGFVEGTVRPICRPQEYQRMVYNGHKRVHALKFQSVVTPNDLIANLFSPVEGGRYDSGMLAMSDLLPQLGQMSFSPTGEAMCIYGDPAYPHRIHLQRPFSHRQELALAEQAFNQSMSTVSVCVEWVFGDIVNYFKFAAFKKGPANWFRCCWQNIHSLWRTEITPPPPPKKLFKLFNFTLDFELGRWCDWEFRSFAYGAVKFVVLI